MKGGSRARGAACVEKAMAVIQPYKRRRATPKARPAEKKEWRDMGKKNNRTRPSIAIVQQGEEVKYYVKIKDVEYYDQVRDTFKVILHYGMQGGTVVREKAEMGADDIGYWFKVDTRKMVGKVVAECQWYVRDGDFNAYMRTEVDRQVLMFVAATHCPRLLICNGCEETHKVEYVRTYAPDLDADFYYLVDCDRNPLVTTEDNENHLELTVVRDRAAG